MTLYLSASSIKDWLSCKRKYYYRTNFRWEGEVTEPLIIGRAVHEAIEKNWKDKDSALESLMFMDLSEDLISKSSRFVNNFFRYFRDMVSEEDKIEQDFKVKYDQDIYIVGKWDRILPTKEIIDWKTSKWIPSTLNDDPQFIIYYESYKQVFGEYPNRLLFGGLDKGKLVNYYPDQLFTNVLYNDVIPDMIESAYKNEANRDGMFKKDYGKINCTYCQFYSFCMKELEEETK